MPKTKNGAEKVESPKPQPSPESGALDLNALNIPGVSVVKIDASINDGTASKVKSALSNPSSNARVAVLVFDNCKGGQIQAAREIISAIAGSPIPVAALVIGENASSALDCIEAVSSIDDENVHYLSANENDATPKFHRIFTHLEKPPTGIASTIRNRMKETVINIQRATGMSFGGIFNPFVWQRLWHITREKSYTVAEAVKQGIIGGTVKSQAEFAEKMKKLSSSYEGAMGWINGTFYQTRAKVQGLLTNIREGKNRLIRNYALGVA